ncbi:MAG: ComEC/Rec2 family competence protein [Actinomycetes bacterium]
MGEASDLRLAVPVAALWLGAWCAPLFRPCWSFVIAGVLLAGAVVLGRRIPWWVTTALVLTGLSAASMTFRIAQLEAAPFSDWVDAGRHVTVHGVLTADPTFESRPGFGTGSAEQVTAHIRAEQVVAGSEQLQVRAPVLVIGDASGWADLRFGDGVSVSGTLQPPDRSEPLAALLFSNEQAAEVSAAPLPLRAAETMRSGLRDAVSGLPRDVQGLLPALVVGDTSQMPSLLTSDMKDSGLAHLTAVSGANVAIVVGAVLLVARVVGVRAYWLVLLGLLSVCWFVLLARPQPSVLRAAVMGSLALVAVGAAGRTQAARSMLAAVSLLLLIDPWLARSWGFALSVAATAGLVLLARHLKKRLPKRWPLVVREAISVASAAQLATLPLVLALSGQVPVLSVLANLLVAPAVPMATVLGAASAAIAPFLPLVATGCAWLAQWPTLWITAVASWSASSPLATLPWPEGWLGGLLAVAALLMGVGLTRWGSGRGWWKPRRLTVAALVATSLVAAYLFGPARWPPPGWVVVACDVGQGDALAVNLGANAAMVVDAGPDPDLVDRCLDRLDINHVPLLVLTHFHADHVEGVPGVLEGRTVDRVLVTSLREPVEQVDEVAAWTSGLPVTSAVRGQTGAYGAATWTVLWPDGPTPRSDDEGSGPNNASVVLFVDVGGVRMLLTGDVEPEAQGALVAKGVPHADVLKVPHHGSKYQDGEFLGAANAQVALVSVGENTYGHPDPALLAALEASGTHVARTDEQGSVAVVSDKGTLRIVALP